MVKLHGLGPVIVLVFAFSAGVIGPAGAQAPDAMEAAARPPAAGRQTPFAPQVIDTASAKPPRWPFVLAGAVVGGAMAGAWYAHQAAKSGDPMIDFSAPVVGIGVGLGALAGLIVGEVVRSVRAVVPVT